MNKEMINVLIVRMPTCMKVVMKAHGGSTRSRYYIMKISIVVWFYIFIKITLLGTKTNYTILLNANSVHDTYSKLLIFRRISR